MGDDRRRPVHAGPLVADAGLARYALAADQGALLELLDHDERPKLIETLGEDFDFAALTEVDDNVREEILDELDPETVIEGVKDLESDDAVYILEDLDKDAELRMYDPSDESGDYMRRAKDETAELDETPKWPTGLDPVKRESLMVLRDLVDLTEAARMAGVIK